ncbi:Hypp1160 [Branchiostoma lanceolatum]|uniref:Hypp1160 protein n=1 Tax=Branchiostoma lanceolatum TaxID=7740 RepID=A0A8J9ZEX6_BRALA|nr:Hypp1160 [Branchiostoma lanceolatum]
MDTTKPEHYSQNSSVQHSLGVEVLQQCMKWEEGDTVLDAGCGTGEICKHISQQPGIASVVGFDASPDFVSYASQYNSSTNILYHVADVSDVTTLKKEWQGAFSKVVSLSVLHWVQDKAAALKSYITV